MYNKVFISYAKEDILTAEKLFYFLENFGFDPWFDKRKLLPGQDWKIEINLALKKADFIILLLSNVSVAKRGFVQREFKLALEFCEEKLDTDIYIIPCKIDDCEIPERLSKYQWTTLNDHDSFDLIASSLLIQRKKYEDLDRKKIGENASFEYKEISIKKSTGFKPKNNVDIIYPMFVDFANDDLKFLNSYFEFKAYESCNYFIKPFGPFDDETVYEDNEMPDNELRVSYNFELITKEFISYTIYSYHYTGGAHGMYGTAGYNYRLNPIVKFELKELFDDDTSVLKTLKRLCKQKFLKKAREKESLKKDSDYFLFEDPFKMKWETFQNFYFKTESFVIIFGIYQLTSYSEGEHEIEITFDEMFTEHPNLSNLKKVKELMKE